MISRASLVIAAICLACASSVSAQFNDITIGSSNSSGTLGNAASIFSVLSSDGRYLVFTSEATNLVSTNDSNAAPDIFLKDRQTGAVERISNATSGSAGNGRCYAAAISADGQFVTFSSLATNLTATTDTNESMDVFIRDRNLTTLERVSVSSNEDLGNAASDIPVVSSDGRYVAFVSVATNLVSGSQNEFLQIYLRDRQAGTTSRISNAFSGGAANGHSTSPAMSADGRFIVFASEATNLTASTDSNNFSDIFLHDTQSGTTTRISNTFNGNRSNGQSHFPSISSSGRYVVFTSDASNMLATPDNDEFFDVFLYDSQTEALSRISRSTAGVAGNGNSLAGVISADGTKVLFNSDATNLVSSDSNNEAGDHQNDVFVHTISGATTKRISVNFNGLAQQGSAGQGAINADGKVFAFQTDANLTSAISKSSQVYVVDDNCTANNDSDGAANCSDACPNDPAKVVFGACGCGVADSDVDADGTLDCVDLCSADAGKSVPGVCGCGVADIDSNGNGAADCNDPTASSIPVTPIVTANRTSIKVVIPSQFLGVRYEIIVSRGGKQVAKATIAKSARTFKLSKGAYTVRYRVKLGTVTTKFSKNKKATIR